MRERRWRNQYIDLVRTKPNYIVPGTNSFIAAEQIELIRSRASSFEKIYCELGSGSGMHLIELARRDPESFYIGFELRFKRTFRTAEKAELSGLGNLLVIRTNAILISDIFFPKSLSGIYINFPDPWDKKRWLKHRLLNEEMLKEMHSLLTPEGFLSYKTDHQEYFEATTALIRKLKLFSIERLTPNLHESEFGETNIESEFEKLFISKGLPVFWLRAKKNS